MKERPILFSSPMVKAILEGRKTQTRRVMKPQPSKPPYPHIFPSGFNGWMSATPHEYGLQMAHFCPYGQPGDRLWVRETWRPFSEKAVKIQYKADGEVRDFDYRPDYEFYACGERWHPSIHMPRWTSRITLEIVSVRPERLQEISEWDAEQEGFVYVSGYPIDDLMPRTTEGARTQEEQFAEYWDSINGRREKVITLTHNISILCGPYCWASNPWVWRIEFRRLP